MNTVYKLNWKWEWLQLGEFTKIFLSSFICLFHILLIRLQWCTQAFSLHFYLDMADDRGGMEASGTRAPRALGHLVFLLINFSDVCSNFILFLRGRKGSGTRVFGHWANFSSGKKRVGHSGLRALPLLSLPSPYLPGKRKVVGHSGLRALPLSSLTSLTGHLGTRALGYPSFQEKKKWSGTRAFGHSHSQV